MMPQCRWSLQRLTRYLRVYEDEDNARTAFRPHIRNNNNRMLSEREAFVFLKRPWSGSFIVDTARGYGHAEKVLGAFFRQHGKLFEVVTNFPRGSMHHRMTLRGRVKSCKPQRGPARRVVAPQLRYIPAVQRSRAALENTHVRAWSKYGISVSSL
jgi:hypothetical protein